LGRGLGALIPTGDRTADGLTELREIPVSAVRPNRFQPRKQFDEASLEDLADSIRELGVLQPILVRQDGEEFELIAGERRWRASQRAGLPVIPALVRIVDDAVSLEQALVENLQRDDLTPIEEARAFLQLMEEFHLTQEQVAGRVGRSRSAVANTLRLLNLPLSVQELVNRGELSAGHARPLLSFEDVREMEQLAARVVREALNVRETERLVKRRQGELHEARQPLDPAAVVEAPSRPAALLELEHLLSAHLDTRVSVQMGRRRGRVVIEFADLDDLERVFRVLTEGRDVDR
jgi:ParB family chromosome partitioning protein